MGKRNSEVQSYREEKELFCSIQWPVLRVSLVVHYILYAGIRTMVCY